MLESFRTNGDLLPHEVAGYMSHLISDVTLALDVDRVRRGHSLRLILEFTYKGPTMGMLASVDDIGLTSNGEPIELAYGYRSIVRGCAKFRNTYTTSAIELPAGTHELDVDFGISIHSDQIARDDASLGSDELHFTLPFWVLEHATFVEHPGVSRAATDNLLVEFETEGDAADTCGLRITLKEPAQFAGAFNLSLQLDEETVHVGSTWWCVDAKYTAGRIEIEDCLAVADATEVIAVFHPSDAVAANNECLHTIMGSELRVPVVRADERPSD